MCFSLWERSYLTMHTIEKFLGLLQKQFAGLEWYGLKMKDTFLSHKGSFVRYTAYIKGFEIKISSHDYRSRNFPHGVPSGVRDRRVMPRGILNWIEITITDNFARFGRRSLLNKRVFPPDTKEHNELAKVVAEIEDIAVFFTPNMGSRLSADQALLGFCKEIGPKEIVAIKPEAQYAPCGCHRVGERVVQPRTRAGFENWLAQHWARHRSHCTVRDYESHLPDNNPQISRAQAVGALWSVVHGKAK
jgi:hypothetical protein